MADEQVTVEWIATQQQVLKAFETLNKRLDTQDQKLHKIGQTSKQTAQIAAGSFAALEKELKDNEKALARMQMGTAEFAAQKQKVDALRKSFRAAQGEVRGVANETRGLGAVAKSGVASVAAMAAGMVGLHQTVQLITTELDRASQMRIAAAKTEQTLEQSLADIALNLGEGSDLGVAREAIRTGAQDANTSQEGFARIVGTAVSAGADDLADGINVAKDALALTAGKADTAETLAGAALDVATLSESKNYQGALGQITQIQKLVRATDPGQFAKNIGNALAAASSTRLNVNPLTTEQAFERAAVFSQVLKDQEGAQTATALSQYFNDIDTFVPERERTLRDKSVARVDQAVIDAFKAERTFAGRERLLQQNESLRLQFIDTLKQGLNKTAKVELVSGTGRAMDLFSQAQKVVTGLDAAVSTFEERKNEIRDATKDVRAMRAGQASIEKFQTGGTRGTVGTAEQIFLDSMNNIDLPGWGDSLNVSLEQRKIQAAAKQSDSAAIQQMITSIDTLTEMNRVRSTDPITASERELALETKQILSEMLRELRAGNNRPVKVDVPARPQDAPLPATTLDQ